LNILIDVGAHIGETVETALDGRWKFDHVHSFEPDPDCVRQLHARFGAQAAAGLLSIHPVALGGRNGEVTLRGDNGGGAASIVADYLRGGARAIRVPLQDVNAFLDGVIPPGGRVFIKLNCEGGEAAILERLCERADNCDIVSIMADFDIVRRSGGYWEKRRLLKKARRRGLPISLSEEVMVGRTHVQRLANWFAYFPQLAPAGEAPRPARQPLKRRLRYFIRDLRSALGGHGRNYR
jgi:FkbM family methyltransferase